MITIMIEEDPGTIAFMTIMTMITTTGFMITITIGGIGDTTGMTTMDYTTDTTTATTAVYMIMIIRSLMEASGEAEITGEEDIS